MSVEMKILSNSPLSDLNERFFVIPKKQCSRKSWAGIQKGDQEVVIKAKSISEKLIENIVFFV